MGSMFLSCDTAYLELGEPSLSASPGLYVTSAWNCKTILRSLEWNRPAVVLAVPASTGNYSIIKAHI